MAEGFSFLSLPGELRDIIYALIYETEDEDYITYQTNWSQEHRRVITERIFSPNLTTAFSLNTTCKQVHEETVAAFAKMKSDPTVHFRLTSRDDAKAWKETVPKLQQRYPGLSQMIVTLNISGEYTYSLTYLPTSLPRLKTLQLEVIDRLRTKKFFLDAHILAHNRSGGCQIYAEKKLGGLVLKDTEHLSNHLMRTGVYMDCWVLKFERDE